MKFLCMLLMAGLSFSCGLRRTASMKVKPFVSEIVYLKGDPLNLIQGARLAEALVLDYPPGLPSYELSLSGFLDRRQASVGTTPSTEEIEENNLPTDSVDTSQPSYTFTLEGSALKLSSNASGTAILKFEAINAEDGEGEYYSLKDLNGRPVKTLHSSVNGDATAISILFQYTDATNSELWVVTLLANDQKLPRPAAVDSHFKYLAGAGVPVGWLGNISLDRCVASDLMDWEESLARKALDDAVVSALNAWSKNSAKIDYSNVKGKIGQRSFSSERKFTFPPFSDVNQHCIYVVDAYDFSSDPGAVTLGVTSYQFNTHLWASVHASIFIPRLVFPDIKPYQSNSRLIQTITHEIGHFLGLDHQFERNPSTNEYLYPSVMSYGNSNLEPYDFQALENIYGAYDPSP